MRLNEFKFKALCFHSGNVTMGRNGLFYIIESIRVALNLVLRVLTHEEPSLTITKQGLDLRYLRQGYLEEDYILDLGRVETTLLDLSY